MTDLKERCLLCNRAKSIKCLIWSYHWRKLLKVLYNTGILLFYKYLQKMQRIIIIDHSKGGGQKSILH